MRVLFVALISCLSMAACSLQSPTPARERLQALFLEVAIRHQHRRARHPSLVERQPDASARQRLRRRQGQDHAQKVGQVKDQVTRA